jgi:alpha-L-rhamnosidase
MIALGLTTTLETPEPSRSDSHAWSAHPNFHLLTTVLGIRPASAGFRTVLVAPALGPLKRASGQMAHPLGTIAVDLRRSGRSGLSGRVDLPPGISGTFLWNGTATPLLAGRNVIDRAGN